MPKATGRYKCRLCGEEFTSNSWDRDYAECKCKRNCLKISGYGSASYFTNRNRGNNFEELECKYWYDDEDYYIMTPEDIVKYDAIVRKVKKYEDKNCDIYTYERYERDINGHNILESLKVEFSKRINCFYETNTVVFYLYMSPKMTQNELYVRLDLLKDTFEAYINQTLELQDRQKLKDEYDWERKQHDMYDYKFYI